jgi:membrane-associated protease RseP (regulator of RpoE activity)
MARGALVCLFLLGGLAAAAAAGPEERPLGPPGARGRIGLQVQPMTPELREHMKAPKEAGVLVVRVEEDMPAAAAGVRVGDVVTGAGGEPVDSPHDLIARIAAVPEGEKIALELVRDGHAMKLEVAPSGPRMPGREGMERWMPGGFQRGVGDLERRLEELERRLEELERRVPPQKET